jgi:hypothetical protein
MRWFEWFENDALFTLVIGCSVIVAVTVLSVIGDIR